MKVVGGGRVGLAVAVLGVLSITETAWAAGQAPGLEEGPQPTAAARPWSEVTAEAAARDLVGQALAGEHGGARAFLKGRRLLELSLAGLADLARARNLDIHISEEGQNLAAAALTLAEAEFDTVITARISHNRIRTYDRVEAVTRLREETTDFEQLQRDFASAALGQPPAESEKVCVVVDGALVNGAECQDNTRFNTEAEFASFEIDPQYYTSGSIGLSKLFQFNGTVSLTLESKVNKKEAYSFLDPLDLALSTDDPIGRGDRFPYTSSLSASFVTPLPFARNFGQYGSQKSIAIKKGEFEVQQAQWGVAARTNVVLGELVESYWALVGALMRLQITAAQRQALEEIAASSRRQYEQQLITAYDMAQAEAELENARNLEELAWTSYIAASNAIVDLLDYDADVVALPVGYGEAFAQDYTVDAAAARGLALENRLELKIARAEVDKRAIDVRFRENQMRPEFTFTATARLGQSDLVFGYESLHDSWLNLFNPDQDDYFIGISYRLPFGKEAEKSALAQARLGNAQALDAYAQTELGITEQVDTALAAVLSSQSEAELARKAMEVAQLAYEKVERLKNLGLATQFELLAALNEVLAARSAFTEARVRYHQAYARLQAAEGLYR